MAKLAPKRSKSGATADRQKATGKSGGKSGEKSRGKFANSLDPITFSVILNRFSTIASEMTLTMEKTAWTSII
ncbi:MAG: hypothetical protein QF767_13760, partial [Alphaproteobacteria bacterium]|nr:hypothetical protein [Alphaproteobacteria bacterium]